MVVWLTAGGRSSDIIKQEQVHYWAAFPHESGLSTYHIRQDGIIAVVEWHGESFDDLGYRTEIFLTNGKSTRTKMSLAEVEEKLTFTRERQRK